MNEPTRKPSARAQGCALYTVGCMMYVMAAVGTGTAALSSAKGVWEEWRESKAQSRGMPYENDMTWPWVVGGLGLDAIAGLGIVRYRKMKRERYVNEEWSNAEEMKRYLRR